jgi:hypothetical protein
MDAREIKNKINDEGWIRVNIMFELLGSPKEHIGKVIKAYIDRLKQNKEVLFMIKEEYGNVEEKEGGLWSAFAECEALVKNLETLHWICINFMPASIEILEPGKFSFQAREIMNWLNDLLAKLHEIGTKTRQATADNRLLLKSINALLRNAVVLCLKKEPMGAEEISKNVGVAPKELEPLFEAMIEEKSVEKKEDKYVLVKKA